MPFLEILHKQSYFEIQGQGTPLVLIHAALLDSRMWKEQVSALASEHRVLTYDLYGYGQSTWTEEKKLDHPGDLAALLDGLEIERAHILGASMGGEIALRFGLEYPQRIRSLILVGAGLEGYDYGDAFDWWSSFIKLLQARSFDAARSLFLQSAFESRSAPFMPDVRATLEQMMEGYTFRHYLDDTLLWKAYGLPAIVQLGEIACPTLTLVGQADTPVNHAIAHLLAAKIGTAHFDVIPGAGHLPNLQHPLTFNRTITDFLSRIEETT